MKKEGSFVNRKECMRKTIYICEEEMNMFRTFEKAGKANADRLSADLSTL